MFGGAGGWERRPEFCRVASAYSLWVPLAPPLASRPTSLHCPGRMHGVSWEWEPGKGRLWIDDLPPFFISFPSPFYPHAPSPLFCGCGLGRVAGEVGAGEKRKKERALKGQSATPSGSHSLPFKLLFLPRSVGIIRGLPLCSSLTFFSSGDPPVLPRGQYSSNSSGSTRCSSWTFFFGLTGSTRSYSFLLFNCFLFLFLQFHFSTI